MNRIPTTSPNTFHTLAASLLCALMLGFSAQAQSVSLLNKSLNDAVRRAQLWGDVPVTLVFACVPFTLPERWALKIPFGLDPHYDFSGQVDTLSIGDDPIFRNYGQPLVLQAWEASTDTSMGWNLDWKQPVLPRLQCASLLHGCQTGLAATPCHPLCIPHPI